MTGHTLSEGLLIEAARHIKNVVGAFPPIDPSLLDHDVDGGQTLEQFNSIKKRCADEIAAWEFACKILPDNPVEPLNGGYNNHET